jgi:hypothetical protein
LHNERTGYPTQKPQALMERLILASSNPGDIVADFFCGAGTTSLVAAKNNRRFIASDISWRAIHTTRSRHISNSDQPFKLTLESSIELPMGVGSTTDIQLADQKLIIKQGLIDSLDYWEVDPAWDGHTFQSAEQAVRPHKNGAIPGELILPGKPGENKIAVRMVMIDGEQAQIIIPG